MGSKSDGEEVFSQVFQFTSLVPAEEQEELRDFLYKFAHNYFEAKEYLQLLKQVHEIEFDSKSELLYRIMAMAIQCFPLAMRRMTDNISERSLQKFIPKVVREEFRDDEVQKIKEIHSHYKIYLNKGVAHQDGLSINEALAEFPDSDVIEEDMKHLKELYLKVVNEICTKYIGLDGDPYDYQAELEKLKIAQTPIDKK